MQKKTHHLLYSYTSLSPFICLYILSFQLLSLHLTSSLLSSSSSFVICQFQLLSSVLAKEKSPLQIFVAAQNGFHLPHILALNSSCAPLRRQRASKVLRYCHLQFLFYLRFF